MDFYKNLPGDLRGEVQKFRYTTCLQQLREETCLIRRLLNVQPSIPSDDVFNFCQSAVKKEITVTLNRLNNRHRVNSAELVEKLSMMGAKNEEERDKYSLIINLTIPNCPEFFAGLKPT